MIFTSEDFIAYACYYLGKSTQITELTNSKFKSEKITVIVMAGTSYKLKLLIDIENNIISVKSSHKGRLKNVMWKLSEYNNSIDGYMQKIIFDIHNYLSGGYIPE